MFWKILFTVFISFMLLMGCAVRPAGTPTYPSMTEVDNIPTLLMSPATEENSLSTNTPMALNLKDEISHRLIYGEDCQQPCFLGIMVNSNIEDAVGYIEKLDLPLKVTQGSTGNAYFSPIRGDGFPEISLIFTEKNGFVQTLNAKIDGRGVSQEEWKFYSPENILKKYGIPDNVEILFLSNGEAPENPGYAMVFYYNEIKLVINYIFGLFDNKATLTACPNETQFELIDVWLGNVLDYQQARGVSLEKATSLTISQFYDLMMEGSKNVCFNLDIREFPQ
ncbi:MAG: hypothetical protein K8S20_06865 [Chloroflexi bacterium]|nr:hypothetical protein [Chloroflexota bacterium]